MQSVRRARFLALSASSASPKQPLVPMQRPSAASVTFRSQLWFLVLHNGRPASQSVVASGLGPGNCIKILLRHANPIRLALGLLSRLRIRLLYINDDDDEAEMAAFDELRLQRRARPAKPRPFSLPRPVACGLPVVQHQAAQLGRLQARQAPHLEAAWVECHRGG